MSGHGAPCPDDTPPMNDAQLHLIYQDIQEIANRVGDSFSALSGARILITGASSYITSYMVDTVLWLNEQAFDRLCHVVALVRSPITAESRLGHLLERDDVTILQQNVSAPISLDQPVDYIIHAASNASPKRYLADPLDTMDANVVGTRQLLEMARAHSVRSFLFFSSSEIYGDVPDAYYPTPERYNGSVDPLNPRACYAESKRYGETLCATFWREHGIPIKIARVFSVYGPGFRLDDGRVMADFMQNRLNHQPIHLLSDGSGVRAFSYTADSVTGFWQMLLSHHNGEVFNIGSDQAVSMRELAQVFGRIDEPPLEVTWQEEPEAHLKGAPSRVCPDISKARRLLGYNPCVGLEDGIRRWLRWEQAGKDCL